MQPKRIWKISAHTTAAPTTVQWGVIHRLLILSDDDVQITTGRCSALMQMCGDANLRKSYMNFTPPGNEQRWDSQTRTLTPGCLESARATQTSWQIRFSGVPSTPFARGRTTRT